MQAIKKLKEPAVRSLAALMNCISGFNTAQLKKLLLKLQISAVEEVPGLTRLLYTSIPQKL